jgi:hypothetical protein
MRRFTGLGVLVLCAGALALAATAGADSPGSAGHLHLGYLGHAGDTAGGVLPMNDLLGPGGS